MTQQFRLNGSIQIQFDFPVAFSAFALNENPPADSPRPCAAELFPTEWTANPPIFLNKKFLFARIHLLCLQSIQELLRLRTPFRNTLKRKFSSSCLALLAV